MIAARGAPLVAIESGVITRTSNSSLGGISIYLSGESGNRYYYAHLDALAAGVGGGMTVSVGDLVGYNGSSGNASYSAPHLHFQYAPPGSTWINPYPLVKALCS
jgi:murein DD-endopeptidase MepM/ murein hydrolase activator NlpD